MPSQLPGKASDLQSPVDTQCWIPHSTELLGDLFCWSFGGYLNLFIQFKKKEKKTEENIAQTSFGLSTGPVLTCGAQGVFPPGLHFSFTLDFLSYSSLGA